MCSNYISVTSEQRLLTFFGAERAPELDPAPSEVWPLGLAPFIRLHEDGSGNRVVEHAVYGLLPGFAKEIAYGRKTYNARSETVATLASFKAAWGKGRRCIIPAEAIFEPCYESGKAVRWRIQQPGLVPMGIAGIYWPWKAPDGRWLWTMAMVTVNADDHPLYRRMHAPGHEKRMPIILREEDYDDWLTCTVAEAPRYFVQFVGPLDAMPAPLPPRVPTRKPPPVDPDADPPQLF